MAYWMNEGRKKNDEVWILGLDGFELGIIEHMNRLYVDITQRKAFSKRDRKLIWVKSLIVNYFSRFFLKFLTA